MAEEQKLARSLRAPNRSNHRRLINLIVKPEYVAPASDANDLTIDATQGSQVAWLRRLREALGVPSRERRISRRTVFGLGLTSLTALGAVGYAGNLVLNRSSATAFKPTVHQPTPTALSDPSRIRWKYTIAAIPFGQSVGVALANDLLICSSLSVGAVVALSSADGTLRWEKTYAGLNTDVPPTVAGGTVYFTSQEVSSNPKDASLFLENTYLVALRVADGSERWRQLIISDDDTSLAAVHQTSTAAVGETSAFVRYNQTLYALDTTTGQVRWLQGAGKPPTGIGEILPAPTISGSAVYTPLGDGKLYAFAVSNGAPRWPSAFSADFPIRSQPLAANGLIYVGADGGSFYALDATTAQVRWKTPLLKTSQTDFRVTGLALSAGVLYIGGGFPINEADLSGTALHGGTVQALDAATGKILWASVPAQHVQLNALQSDYLRARPLVVGNDVVVATRVRAKNGRNLNVLFALDKTTGTVRWNFDVWGEKNVAGAGAFPSSLVASSNTLYVASGDEVLYALSFTE